MVSIYLTDYSEYILRHYLYYCETSVTDRITEGIWGQNAVEASANNVILSNASVAHINWNVSFASIETKKFHAGTETPPLLSIDSLVAERGMSVPVFSSPNPYVISICRTRLNLQRELIIIQTRELRSDSAVRYAAVCHERMTTR